MIDNGEITLIEGLFGMGNINHVHVHRHNQMLMQSEDIDRLKMESLGSGTVSMNSINLAAERAGGISTTPNGHVNIEDGWNIRRGLGMLRFMVTNNQLLTQELTVLGYLTGGGATAEGIEESTMFVPVRSWSLQTTNVADPFGLPQSKTIIAESNQFLMGDPHMGSHMKSIRPLDFGNDLVGLMTHESDNNQFMEMTGEDQSQTRYDGAMESDLRTMGVVVSKTLNLNTTHHARELIKLANSGLSGEAAGMGSEYAVADALAAPSLGELLPTHNPFLRVMEGATGSVSMNGFQGYSIGSIGMVFSTLPDVMNIQLLDEGSYEDAGHLYGSSEYGSSSYEEVLSTELAYLTVHAMIQRGLTSLTISATNDIDSTGGIMSEDGVAWGVPGQAMSVMTNDNFLAHRVEEFKSVITNHFFSKYNRPDNRITVSVNISCYLFGETIIEIMLDGNPNRTKRYVNATYCVNRTSPNIAANSLAMSSTKAYFDQVKTYFSS